MTELDNLWERAMNNFDNFENEASWVWDDETETMINQTQYVFRIHLLTGECVDAEVISWAQENGMDFEILSQPGYRATQLLFKTTDKNIALLFKLTHGGQ